jgi:hypothetical protein
MAENCCLPDPYPQQTVDQALAAVTSKNGPLPPFPSGPAATWEDAKAAYLWAKAVVEMWGDAAPMFIANVISDAVRAGDICSFRGWSVVQIALLDFARMPQDQDAIH